MYFGRFDALEFQINQRLHNFCIALYSATETSMMTCNLRYTSDDNPIVPELSTWNNFNAYDFSHRVLFKYTKKALNFH